MTWQARADAAEPDTFEYAQLVPSGAGLRTVVEPTTFRTGIVTDFVWDRLMPIFTAPDEVLVFWPDARHADTEVYAQALSLTLCP